MNDLAQILPADFARRHLRTGRQLIEAQRDRPDDGTMATGTGLDELLRGGLERGRLTELTGRGARFSVVVAALAATTRGGEAAALLDLGDGFDPRGARAAGVELERLLWARPRSTKELLRCAEAVLDAALPLVVLELGLPPVPGGRGAEAFWLRLARAAQSQRTALLVSSPYRACGTAAHTVIESRARRGRWLGRGLQPRLLDGAVGRLQIVKGSAKGGPADRGWHQATGVELSLRLSSAVAVLDEPTERAARERPTAREREMPRWATA
ncbi:MAG: hypothetical protein AAGC60_18865 [Acidobacteriota bacterium]